MANEDRDFDAGEFYQEGIEKAGIEPEADEDEAAVQEQQDDSDEKAKTEDDSETLSDALKSTEQEEESEEETESVIQSILPQPEETETEKPKKDLRVPVEDHVKLRERAQRAEREAEELRQKLAEKESSATEEEKSPLETFVEENPDEDFVPASVQLAERKFQEARARKAAEAAVKARQDAEEQIRQFEQAKQDSEALTTKATMSEKTARQKHKDYDKVTKAAIGAKLFSPDELRSILNSDNPGESFYTESKAKIKTIREGMGLPAEESTQPTPPEEEEEESENLTDEEVFNAIYPEE